MVSHIRNLAVHRRFMKLFKSCNCTILLSFTGVSMVRGCSWVLSIILLVACSITFSIHSFDRIVLFYFFPKLCCFTVVLHFCLVLELSVLSGT